jgi:inactivated superfamily I helicase
LVYFKADDVRVLPIDIERDPEKSASLENWKRALAEQHTVATFTTPEDLAMKVATDLARTMQAKDLAGQSAVARHPSALREEIEKLIRRATDLDVPDEYILLQIRAVLRELIDEASDIRVRIVLIYASSDSGIARISAIELERRRADVLMLEMDDDGAVPLGELTAALESAELGAVFLSNVSVSAKWMRAEVDAAVWRQISMPGSTPILPILLSDVDVPALLRTSPVVDVRNLNEMDAIAHILDAVERRRSEVRRTNPMPSWWKTMRY